MKNALLSLAAAGLIAAGCSNSETEQLKKTTIPTYDPKTGKLTQVTFDLNKNGKIDTWTEMDGPRPVLTETDRDEDGKIDRWEYFDKAGKIEKVGFSRQNNSKPDAWAFSGPSGRVERIEVSSTSDVNKIDRWEHYDETGLVSAEEDTNGDGKPDKWDRYKGGVVKSVAFDENADGIADRRLTYEGSRLVLIETQPDGMGNFLKREPVK